MLGLGGLLLGALAGLPPMPVTWEPPAAEDELTNLEEAIRCLFVVCPCVDDEPDK